MAKHEVVIHENKGAMKETAPYTGNYISKETIKLAAFIPEIAKKCGLPAIQVQAILTGAFDIIGELEQESLVRIHTDVGTICGVITGSFPTADAAFDTERNALELALRLDEAIHLALADVVPAIVTDESLTKLRVDNVMDLTTPKPYNLIHGQGRFRVAGFNMVLDDEGAVAFVQNALGATFDLVIDEVVSKQLFVAHTAQLLEPGDYKLVVKSRAGDAEGPLQSDFRKVKYLKVEPEPEPEPIAESEDGITKVMTFVDAETGADRVITGMNDFVLDGEGLKLAEDGGDGVTQVMFHGPGLETYLDLTDGARNDGSKLIASVGSYVDTLEPGDHECHLGLYLKHGEATGINVWIDFTLRKE